MTIRTLLLEEGEFNILIVSCSFSPITPEAVAGLAIASLTAMFAVAVAETGTALILNEEENILIESTEVLNVVVRGIVDLRPVAVTPRSNKASPDVF